MDERACLLMVITGQAGLPRQSVGKSAIFLRLVQQAVSLHLRLFHTFPIAYRIAFP